MYIEEMVNKKFHCLQIDSHITWKNHKEQTISELGGACDTVWSTSHISNIYTLQ